jgi:hypothetical protein
MEERFRKELESVRIWPLGKDFAEALRVICTHLGHATYCPAAVCKRARACATRDVLCWQVAREEVNSIILHLMAHIWQRRIANGESPDVPPDRVRTYERILEREKGEASAASGAGEVSDTVARWSKGEL